MPYVIQNAQGLYLKHLRNARRREWVPYLDQASVWEKSGSAKNAAHQVLRQNRPTKELFLIQEVKLMAWGSPEPLLAKSLR